MEKNKGKKTTPTSNNQNIESSVTGRNLPSNTTMSNPVKEYNSNNSQNHQNLKDYLQQHYPNLFREGKLSFQELKDEIGQNTYNEDIVEENFSFGLSWAGEKKAKAILSDEVEKTLVYDEDKSLHGKSSENILIEGDNLEALKLLSNGYYNSIKMIYIDPPYNTGNDFVYNDKFSTRETEYLKATNQKDEAGNKLTSNPKSNGRFHSNWLTMMYPRLRLARDLLKEDGVVFISIDDNEVANLKLLCNQIFGEENFVGCFIWNTKNVARGVPTVNMVVSNHEYILCYSKTNNIKFLGTNRDEADFKNPDKDSRGLWRSESITATGKQNNYFTIINPMTKEEYTGNWAFSKKKIIEMISNNLILFPSKINGIPRQKKFMNSYVNDKKAIVTNLGWYSTENSTKDLMELFNNIKVFDFPKPVGLTRFLVKQTTENDDIILDFFAGSGTTGHAVMQLNAEDGGNRKFILVQLDEKTAENSEAKKAGFHYISDITAERLLQASKKIAEELQAQPPTLNLEGKDENPKPLDLGFKFFKVDKPYFPLWNYNAKTQDELKTELKNTLDNLEQANRTDIQIIYEILNKLKLQLNCSIKPFTTSSSTKSNLYNIQYGNNGTNYDAIVIMDNISEDIVKEVLALKPVYLIILEKSFNGNNSLKINIETLLAKQDNIQVHYV